MAFILRKGLLLVKKVRYSLTSRIAAYEFRTGTHANMIGNSRPLPAVRTPIAHKISTKPSGATQIINGTTA